MYPTTKLGGEGASVHVLRHPAASLPNVVVVPFCAYSAAATCDALLEIYRLAYERAQATLCPSLYEWASRRTAN
jgi:hypothetical protein